jgi:hypothetical protein
LIHLSVVIYNQNVCNKKDKDSRGLVAHTCNPRYSGGRDQEDQSLKPAWANSSRDTILKQPITKKGLVEWLEVKSLSASPSTTKKKKEKKRIFRIMQGLRED